MGRQGVYAAINTDLRHVTLFGHNSQTAKPMGMPKVNSESRQPKLSYDIKSTQNENILALQHAAFVAYSDFKIHLHHQIF